MDAMRSGEKRTDPRTDNQVLIDKYHELTTRQARTSYRNSQYAMAVGFALLVLGGAIALRSPSGAGQVVIGTLTALGTSLSAYLGATFLRAYERALLQMNYYFGQPLVTSYILQAERLSGALSSDRRDEAIVSIIQEALRGASNASQALNPVVEGQASTGRSRRGRSAGGASSGAPAGS
ncbi:TRADD-N-associated membrane domain-containing protein [Streptomyces griseorubiginosus]|uniref:TRADD-N-associated membrane domain-containing protein n=1 Tax=Streptomyces griseorubiginosus TaxID=67304 RepID=UPI0036661795